MTITPLITPLLNENAYAELTLEEEKDDYKDNITPIDDDMVCNVNSFCVINRTNDQNCFRF